MHPRPEDGDRRVLLEPKLPVEPLEPHLDRGGPARGAQREHQLADEPREAVDVSGVVRVDHTGLRLGVRLAPRRCSPVDLDDELGLPPLQLRAKKVPKLAVVPVPGAPPTDRYEEQVGLCERLQPVGRPGGLEHRVAERPGHPVEHRGSREEPHVLPAQPGEVLEVEEVGHEAVVAARVARRARSCAPVLHREGSEVGACGPALGLLRQLRDPGLVDLQPERAEHETDLPAAEPELLDADLQEPAGGPRSCDREPRQAATGEHQRRSVGDVLGEGGNRPNARPGSEEVDVVEDQHDGMRGGGERGREPRERRRSGAPG